MSGRSASLLTKKQRRRIRDEFADLDEEQLRREQQRIRDRVRSGVLDFQLLVEHPDRQLELALDDVPEDELRSALADATLFVERVRELRKYDRDEMLLRARDRADDLAARSDDLRSLDDLDLRTATEIRRETRATVREQFEDDLWDGRADGLLKLAASAALPLFGVVFVNSTTSANLLGTSVLAAVLFFLSAFVVGVTLAGVFLIKGAQTLKYNLLPAIRALRRDPVAALGNVLGWLRRPGEALRQAWEDL
jgi:hypothetical protein